MYLRFETNLYFKETSHKKGIFAAMGDLKRMNLMNEQEILWYENTAKWFNETLPNPKCFEKPISDKIKFSANSWFKKDARDFIIISLEVVKLLRKYDIHVNELYKDSLDNIIYEDKFQAVTI